LTQDDAAAALGIDVRTYRRYESGAVNAGGFDVRHATRSRLLARMSDELGLDPAAAIEVARTLDDRAHVVRGTALLGAILTDAGDLDEAGRAFARVRELGDDPVARRGIGEAEYLVARGELEEAELRTARNARICEARGWPGHVAHCALVRGTIAARRGDVEAARAWLAAVRDWTDRTGEIELVLGTHLLAAELGEAFEARICAELALRLGYATARARALALR
jgi:hypothetical protein